MEHGERKADRQPPALGQRDPEGWGANDSTNAALRIGERRFCYSLRNTGGTANADWILPQSLNVLPFIDFSVGIAEGEWTIRSRQAVKNGILDETNKGFVSYLRLVYSGNNDDSPFVAGALDASTFREDAVKIVLVDKTGRKLSVDPSSNLQADRSFHTGDLRSEPVEIQVMTRPYEWVRFRNVRLPVKNP